MPFGPGAFGVFVLQAADQREGNFLIAARPDATGLQLQRAVVVKQLGHLAQAGQLVATAHHRALAIAADRVGRLCA